MLTRTLKNGVPAIDDQKEPTFSGRVPNAVGAAGSLSSQSAACGASTFFPVIGPGECRRYIRQARAQENAVAAEIRRRGELLAREPWRHELAPARGVAAFWRRSMRSRCVAVWEWVLVLALLAGVLWLLAKCLMVYGPRELRAVEGDGV